MPFIPNLSSTFSKQLEIIARTGRAGHALRRNSKQTAELHKHAISRGTVGASACACVCVLYLQGCEHTAVWAAAVRMCVHRLATMFTVSN